jgi:diguanylate cyclase (GGDEF)-like protein
MRVLIAEDNVLIQNLLLGLLTKWGYDVVIARTGEEAWGRLQADTAPPLAILDWMMPGLDGTEVCRRVRAQLKSRYIYLILLSARSDQQDIVEALEAGADDYITKPFHAGELRARIRSAVRVVQLEEKLARQAHYDSLTGLPNRVLLADRLEQALRHAKRHSELVGFFYIDLDRFKVINDSLGHAVGDTLLQQLTLRLKTCARDCDTLARLGGDEFALVAGGLKNTEEASAVSSRILTSLETPFDLNGHPVRVTASIGVTIYPDDGGDMSSLQQNADAAMYESKRRVRNGFQFFNTDIRHASRGQLDMEQSLSRAIENGELTLVYQPVYKLVDGKIGALETLTRWNNPILGAVPPNVFVPLAEETGCILPIGSWVLLRACRQAQSWAVRGMGLPVTVNVSPLQLGQMDFVSTVQRALHETGLDPRLLKLEVTESIRLRDFEKASATLRHLRTLGIEIWIDDFGTGYSCFTYVRKLPVDAIKIAAEFVQDIGKHGRGLPMLRGIVALAHNLGLGTIAEGVETAEQLEAVRSTACDQAQGFLLGRPQAAEEVDWIVHYVEPILDYRTRVDSAGLPGSSDCAAAAHQPGDLAPPGSEYFCSAK